MKGTYCLLIRCYKDFEKSIGKLGMIRFARGYYLYIGSGLNNMEKRLSRHLLRKKNKFWHIDYLTCDSNIFIEKIYVIENPVRLECVKAKEFSEALDYVPGFGSSDCRCRSHLFYSGENKDMLYLENQVVLKSGFRPYKRLM
jgi:Uri superfamily endonuclease